MGYILEGHGLRVRDSFGYPMIGIVENKTTFICGESGCGKSTLLKLFNATMTPSEGRVIYKGRNILNMDTVALRREVLLVGQAVFLFEDTIKGNFRQYYFYRAEEPPTEALMQKYLAICCLNIELSAYCPNLSGGERQRVFMAIGLSFLPKVLMLDEPTSALDEGTGKRFFEQIEAFCKEKKITLVVVSHDRSLAERFGDAKITLESGGVDERGS